LGKKFRKTVGGIFLTHTVHCRRRAMQTDYIHVTSGAFVPK